MYMDFFKFKNSLTDQVKENLLDHFNTIYEIEALAEREYKISFLASIWNSDLIRADGEGWLLLDEQKLIGVTLDDYELFQEVPSGEEGGTNLDITSSYYEIPKIIEILK